MGYCLTYIIDLLNIYDVITEQHSPSDVIKYSASSIKKHRKKFRELCWKGGLTFGEGMKLCESVRNGSYKITYIKENKENCSCKECYEVL